MVIDFGNDFKTRNKIPTKYERTVKKSKKNEKQQKQNLYNTRIHYEEENAPLRSERPHGGRGELPRVSRGEGTEHDYFFAGVARCSSGK